jgi:FKBP-type peptidyl-prolyl cis-trans isomerase SlyD
MTKHLLLISLILLNFSSLLWAENNAVITKGKQVEIHYTLKLPDGQIVSSSLGKKPLNYIHGTRSLIVGLENELEGMKVGQKKNVKIPPELGYGEFQSGKVIEVKKDTVKGEIQVGAFLTGTQPDGTIVTSRIIEVKPETVVLDFNHPMAGKTLLYEVEVVSIKDSAAS